MVVHHRLENALARAEELIAVGNQSAALQLLHESIVSRWFQHNLLALDAITLKFVELCVDLRRGRLAKDGLHQYRSMCQNSNVAGLENVMKHFLEVAERRLEDAHSQATSSSSGPAVVEDLEESADIIASVWGPVLGEDRDRNRETIAPWLRFVWEAYRIILDICRHNAKLESLYRTIVERAFSFCRRYGRKAEFRRLCEMLRHHLGLIVKYPDQANGVSLKNPTSHQLQLELRFEQLGVATEMELWHEAFRSIEDIHGLFVLARKSAKPSLVMTYYERLCCVFQMADNYLFLAATLCKLFALAKSQNEASLMGADASRAILALLAVPLLHDTDVTNTMSGEDLEAKNTRLAHLLGLQKAPTRAGLVKELMQREILAKAEPSVQALFAALEVPYGRAVDREAVGQLLAQLESHEKYRPFVPFIYRNFAARTLAHLSHSSGSKIVPVETITAAVCLPKIKAAEAFNLEHFILEGCRSGDFYLRIDHQSKSVRFEKPCFAPLPHLELHDATKNASFRLVEALQRTLKELGVATPETSTEGPSAASIDSLIADAYASVEAERRGNLARKMLIEERKKQLEEIQQRKEREEARERAARLAAEQEAEKIRQTEEAARREAARKEAEREEIRREQALKREEEERKKKEAAARRANLEKMIAVVKRIDHLERALRQEELPLLQGDYERQKQEDRRAYEERVTLIRQKAQAQHEVDIQLKHSLQAMTEDCQRYIDGMRHQRDLLRQSRQEANAAQLEVAKEARRQKARAQAQAKREADERKAREAEERRLAEEKRLAEEEAEEQERAAARRMATEGTRSSPQMMAGGEGGGGNKYIPPSIRQGMAASAMGGGSVFGSRSSPFAPRGTTTTTTRTASGTGPFGSSGTGAGASSNSSSVGGGSWRRA